MTTNTLSMSPSDFQALATKLDQTVQTIREQVPKVNNAVAQALSVLPADLGARVKAGAAQFSSMVSDFLTEISKYFTELGDPGKLFQTGSDWYDNVGKKAGQNSAEMDADAVTADDYWTGIAGMAYGKIFPRQKVALTGILDASKAVQSALTALANGIIAFLVAAAAFLVLAAAGIAAAIVGIWTGVGAPAGIAGIIMVLATLASQCFAALAAFATYVAVIKNQMVALQQSIGAGYPGGKWPVSTTLLDNTADWKPVA